MGRDRTTVVLLLLLLLFAVPGAYLLGRGSSEPAAPTPPPEPPPAVEPGVSPPEPLAAAPLREPAPVPAPEAVPPAAPPVAEPVDESRRAANETAAIATLRNISSAQAQFQATGVADEDGDGTGEFGTFGELSGNVVVRGTERKLNPPVLSGAFRSVDHRGVVSRSGYHFAVFLPRPGGQGLGEAGGGGLVAGETAPDLAEKNWICYAWPVEHGRSGSRTFVVNVQGDILATDTSIYSGTAAPPADSAVRQTPGAAGLITGLLIDADRAPDGNEWEDVGPGWVQVN